MEKVLSYLKDNEARFIEQLCDYVRFASVSAQTNEVVVVFYVATGGKAPFKLPKCRVSCA